MKKVLVVVALLVAAAAWGGGSGAGSSYTSNESAPNAQTGAGTGAPSKAVGHPKGSSSDGGATLPNTPVPALPGPPVIRQAALSLSVESGAFDSKLAQARTLLESKARSLPPPDPH